VHSEGIARRCRTMRTCAAQTLCYSSVAFHADSDGEIPVSEKAFSIAQIRSYPLTGPRTPVDSFDRQLIAAVLCNRCRQTPILLPSLAAHSNMSRLDIFSPQFMASMVESQTSSVEDAARGSILFVLLLLYSV